MNVSLRELLLWVDREPRSYTQAMQAWQSSCPRFTTWEDALEAQLISVSQTRVVLTPIGEDVLRGHRPC